MKGAKEMMLGLCRQHYKFNGEEVVYEAARQRFEEIASRYDC